MEQVVDLAMYVMYIKTTPLLKKSSLDTLLFRHFSTQLRVYMYD